MTGVKINTAKLLLDSGRYMITTEASARLAIYLTEAGWEISRQVEELVDKENESRRLNGLPPRRKVTAEDVWKVIR